MCGILGWLSFNNIGNYANFNLALETLRHRGPDRKGIWQDENILLGHQRLSIIDLSENGNQPMVHKQNGSVLIFNGEIYNYKELKKELILLGYKFFGNSDTEVLLKSLVEWGPEAISKLNGMWAFAFWSPKSKQLLLSRDRFGVKPLYFIKSNNGLAFASEPKALLKLFPEYRCINENSLMDFFGNNLLYIKGESFYKNINVFPQAHYGIYKINNNELKNTRYWNYPKNINQNLSENDALEEFSVLLQDSVNLRLRSDVPVGITLSGGLDSTSLLAAATTKNKKTINCFTSIYEENLTNEFKWAKIASEKINSKLIPVLSKENDWLNSLKKIVWHMDGPGYSPAVYPLWNLMKRSKLEGVPVLLDGQGADESLAGYNQYVIHNALEKLGNKDKQIKNIGMFFNNMNTSLKTFGFSSSILWLIKKIIPSMYGYYKDLFGLKIELSNKSNDSKNYTDSTKQFNSLRDILIEDHSRKILPGLLHYGDAMSMAHAVEVRNPFLDYRLVEWIFKLPDHILFNHNETKWVLRDYLRKNNQAKIANRYKKNGYYTPIKNWLTFKKNNEIEKLLLSNDNPMLQWIEKKRIKKLIALNKSGIVGADLQLYKVLVTQIWMQKCLHER